MMAEAKSKDNWNHTAATLAMIFNVNRDPKKQKAITPSELNPHEKKKKSGIPLTTDNLKILKKVFVEK